MGSTLEPIPDYVRSEQGPASHLCGACQRARDGQPAGQNTRGGSSSAGEGRGTEGSLLPTAAADWRRSTATRSTAGGGIRAPIFVRREDNLAQHVLAGHRRLASSLRGDSSICAPAPDLPVVALLALDPCAGLDGA